MSKKEKDWTFIDDDGSLQIEQFQVVYAAKQGHNEAKKDSDSEQEFEVLATSQTTGKRGSNDISDFKGISIKEDHFAEDLQDDGSDIEVLKPNHCHSDDKNESPDDELVQEIEDLLVSAYEKITMKDVSIEAKSDDFVLQDCDDDCDSSLVMFPFLTEEDELNETLEEKEQKVDVLSELPYFNESFNDGDDDNDDLDGIIELFEETDYEVSPSDKSSIVDSVDSVEAKLYANVMERGTEDGIILSTSVFIIILCLSVILGLFIGKGLNYVYTKEEPKVADIQKIPSEEQVTEPKSSETNPQVIVFTNNSIHKLNYTTLWIAQNAKRNSFDMAVAYQEMQHKFDALQKKYQQLNEQYNIQKHVSLFNKKRFFLNADRGSKQVLEKKELPKLCFDDGNKKKSRNDNQSDVQKELIWWKMRTAVWRQKYLDLKVDLINERRRCALMGKRNVTFNSCGRLLTQYFPNLNVSDLLKSATGGRFAKSAKTCWRKVLSPVEAVRRRMKAGFVFVGQNVDDAWAKIKMKWDANSQGGKQYKKDDIRGKMSSKWRRFRRVFSISNIVGKTFWKKSVVKCKSESRNQLNGDGMVCHGKGDEIPRDFKERWSFDAKREDDVSYLPPILPEMKKPKFSPEDSNGQGDVSHCNKKEAVEEKDAPSPNLGHTPGSSDDEDAVDNQIRVKSIERNFPGFKPCSKIDIFQKISQNRLQSKQKVNKEELSQMMTDLDKKWKTSEEAKPAEETDFPSKHLGPMPSSPDDGSKINIKKIASTFRPCKKIDSYQRTDRVSLEDKLRHRETELSQKFTDLQEQMKEFSGKKNGELEWLQSEIEKFQAYREKKESELKNKRVVMEGKLRKNSNKYRREHSLLKLKAEQMEKVVTELQQKFHQLMAEKLKEMKMKNRSLKRKIKSFQKKSQQQKERMKNNDEKWKEEAKKNKEKFRSKEKELISELKTQKENFLKWKVKEKGKLAREIAGKWNSFYQEREDWKLKKAKTILKICKAMKEKENKLRNDEKNLIKKVEELKKALKKLLKEENEKFQLINKKNEELKKKQEQVELMKLFYTFGLKKEKEKHEKSKESILRMEEKAMRMENLYKEIIKKYDSALGYIAKLKAKRARSTPHQNYYPVVYCPDQKYCQGVKDDVKYDFQPPVVYCPRKDFCSGWSKVLTSHGVKDDVADEISPIYTPKSSNLKQAKLPEKSTAVRPIPPITQQLSKFNPFFMDLSQIFNKTSNDNKPTQKPTKKPVKPEIKKNGQWYFELMKERENQRSVPLSWYLYWSRGREDWRSSTAKTEGENWYLRLMQEREKQRGAPVTWYFKQNKEKEEEQFGFNKDWEVNRAKGRQEARDKEGYYYCW